MAVRRRDSAPARPTAVNEEAATAACLIAAITSATGAVLATNADAPVSRARNSRSSSPLDVSMLEDEMAQAIAEQGVAIDDRHANGHRASPHTRTQPPCGHPKCQ